VPVALVYHAVLPLSGADGDGGGLVVDPGELDWQLGEIVQRGLRSLRLGEYHAALEGDPASADGVLITFDDAYAHVFEAVSPLLDKHGLTAVVFVPVAGIDGRNDWDGAAQPLGGHPLATREQLARAAAGPWELASHGLAHVDLRALAPVEQRSQLSEARERLSALVGSEVLDLAYPYGLSDAGVRAAAKDAGYRMAFGLRGTRGDRFDLPRLVIRGREGRMAFRVRLEPGFRHVFG
jgi:peptidoglycan/xylan/chitin deacetylase (PgdA/CDA1 family)